MFCFAKKQYFYTLITENVDSRGLKRLVWKD